jgi:hypothetical protein
MDIWLVWLKDGEWGESNLMDPAHGSRASAMSWCNENRKLENGDSIAWQVNKAGDEWGESANIVLDLGRTKLNTTRYYSLQVMKLED